ncbi:response regulator [Teredinibacter turnerae]|uniref:response regulator n=1 Tax=Teredinibacter turnerae TaxID=2426 RepID=UPI0005F8976F|nr:response regulator [Teredinibacter turnerae]
MNTSKFIHRKSFLTGTLIAAAVALLSAAAGFTDWVNNERFYQQQRLLAQNELATVRARLEGNLNTDFEVLRGLQAVVSLEPQMSQARFAQLARQVIEAHPQLRNIGAAPDMVIRYVFPLVGNEAALGLDYRNHPEQRKAAEMARDTGEMVVAGPIQLEQGGVALIGRLPVYTRSESGLSDQFWGLLSAVIDLDEFYLASQLTKAETLLQIAIKGRDGDLVQGDVFYGDASVFEQEPVVTRVDFPNGGWEVAAIPRQGWLRVADDAWIIRLLETITIGLFAAAGAFVIRLSRIRELQQARLRSLFDMSPIGIALNDLATGNFLEINDALLEPTGYTREELSQLSFAGITASRFRKEELEQKKILLRDGRYGPVEKEFIRKDGSRYPVSFMAVLVDDHSGRQCVWSIVEDLSQREAAQQALDESRENLHRFFELSGSLMCTFTHLGEFKVFNNAFLWLLGYTKEEVQSSPFLSFVHPEDYREVVAELEHLLKVKTSTSFVCRVRCKDGSYVHLNWNVSVDPASSNVYATAVDVTSHREHESRLAQQQEMLQSMSKLARIGAWEINLAEAAVHWSGMTKVIHEVDEDFEPFLDSALQFYKSGKSLSTIEQAIQLCTESGQAFSEEVQITTAKGHDLWVLVTGKAEFHDGRCVRIYGSYQDINARKLIEQNIERTQQELQQQMSMLQLIAESQASFIEQNDIDSAFQEFLDNILKLTRTDFGFIAEIDYDTDKRPYLHRWYFAGTQTVCDKDLSSCQLNDYEQHLRQALFRLQPVVLENIDQTWHMCTSPQTAVHINNFLGVPITHSGNGIALVGLANRVGGFNEDIIEWLKPLMNTVGQFVHGARGIHARQKAEKALVAAKEAAEQAAHAKSDFLAMMSHEIRTPLNGVMGMLSLLNRTQLSDEQRRKLTIASHSSNTLLNIINDILDFSKVDAGKIELESIEFNLIAQLEEFSESMAMRAQEKHVELILDTTDINTPMVCGDPGRIRQVLANLVGNSIKFTAEGEVLVRCALVPQKDDLIFQVSVVDTGIGIETDKLDELFNPFTQVDASTTREYGGTGLGLAICKKLCVLMGGDITARSELGIGSTFDFHVLLQACEQQVAVPDINLENKSVLLIEDNKSVRDLVYRWLDSWGANVFAVEDGAQGLARCQDLKALENLPDVVLIDQYLPDQTGCDLAKQILGIQGCADLPVLILSRIAEGELQKFCDAGARGYVAKPLTRAGLVESVKVLLEGGSTLRGWTQTKEHSQAAGDGDELDSSQVNGRVLLVEDNPVNQDVARMMLDDVGVVVTTAGNGVEALDALQSAQQWDLYSLVLMDCQMPEMDGYETTRNIRAGKAGEIYKKIPIIAMTANAMKGDKERCFAAGMDDYISKPIDPQVLEDRLRKWLPRVPEPNSQITAADTLQPKAINPVVEMFAANLETNANSTAATSDSEVAPDQRWDYDAMLASLKNRDDRVRLLLRSFCGRMPETLAEFKLARDHNDYEKIGFIAHSTKGSAAQLRAYQLQGISAELEKRVKTGELDGVTELAAAMATETSALLIVLNAHLES